MTPEEASQILGGVSYGDQQSMLTGVRSSYGDYAAQVAMGGSVISGGISSGFSRMFSDIGKVIDPVTYTPPARVQTGFYGQYYENQSLFSSMMRSLGIQKSNSSASRLSQIESATGDFSSRMVSGGSYLASTAAMLAGGAALSPAMGALGAGIGGVTMGGMGATVGGLAGGLLGGFAVAGMATDAVMGAVQARREIQDYLGESSFRFAGSGSSMVDSRTGRGMSREARREVSSLVRQLDISDPTLNTEDLTSILKGADQNGLFVGAGSDINQFKEKFKSVVENVKIVSQTLNQSLEEGLKTMKEFKSVGITGGDVRAALASSQALGLASGRTAAEMVGLGLQGAEMYRGTGVSMSVGFAGAQMNLSSIRAARDASLLSQEAISQAGGEEALAMRMTSSGLQFAQSSFGRGFGAGLFNPTTGGMDPGSFMNMAMSGGGDLMSNYQKSIGVLSSPANIVKYQVNQEKFMGEVGNQFGGTGLQMMQNMFAASMGDMLRQSVPGLSQEDAFKFVLRQQGMSSTEIETRLAQIKSADKTFEANVRGAERTRDEKVVEEAMNNNDLLRLGENVKDRVKKAVDVVAEPINRVMDNVESSVRTSLEENVFGIRRGDLSGINMNALSESGGTAASPLGQINLDKGGLLSRTQGEALYGVLKSGELGDLTRNMVERNKDSDVILKQSGGFMGLSPEYQIGISEENVEKVIKESQRVHSSMVNASELKKKGELDKVSESVKQKFESALVSGRISGEMGIGALVKSVTGKDISEVDSKTIAAISLEAENLGSLGDSMKRSRDTLAGGLNASQGMTVERMADLRDRFDSLKEKVSDAVGFDVAGGFVENLSGAMATSNRAKALLRQAAQEKDPKRKAELQSQAADLQKRARGYTATAIRSQAEATGMDPSVVAKQTSDFMQNAEGRGLLEEGGELGVAMLDLQTARGSTALGQALDVDIRASGLEGSDLNKLRSISDKLTVGDISSRREALLSLSGSERSLLTEAGGVGKRLADQSKILMDIKEADSKSELKKILEGSSIKGDTNKIASIMDSYSSKNTDAAVNKAYTIFQSGVVGDTLTSAAGASSGVGTQTGTAQEDFARTVSVQVATLHAMEALAKRLKLTQ